MWNIRPALPKQAIHKSRFTMIDMSNHRHVAEAVRIQRAAGVSSSRCSGGGEKAGIYRRFQRRGGGD
ncbi:hypothetical protein HanIR_Chr17g0880031 [Helianthus annuus]|nr:hypothetical protein HanIR_Chr17g0880031 [Helianthus annuus]